MKAAILIALSLSSLPLLAEVLEIDLSQFGEPIKLPSKPNNREKRPDTKLDREIAEFRTKHEARIAVLINNADRRALDAKGRVKGLEGLGDPVDPKQVLVIAEAMVTAPVVELYTSIKRLPECAHTVHIIYTESPDRSKSSLLGYTIIDADETNVKLVKYEGNQPWLDWINKSFEKDDAERVKSNARPSQVPDPPSSVKK